MQKIAAEAVAIVKQPDVVPQFAALGNGARGRKAEDAFGRAIADEIARVSKVVESAGIKPE